MRTTVNLPDDATVEDVRKVYIEGWKRGVKALAVYRDGSKNVQVLSTSKESKTVTSPAPAQVRKKLPRERNSVTHDFRLDGYHGYVTVGLYDDGEPGELWINISQEGSTLSGVMDAFAKSVSTALQYGVPLASLVKKFKHMKFEPYGMTDNKDIPMASSLIDYIFKYLEHRFVNDSFTPEVDVNGVTVQYAVEPLPDLSTDSKHRIKSQLAVDYVNDLTTKEENVMIMNDATPCYDCGALMVRVGACEQCLNCGATGGCS